jgi:hypothetical protein
MDTIKEAPQKISDTAVNAKDAVMNSNPLASSDEKSAKTTYEKVSEGVSDAAQSTKDTVSNAFYGESSS